jgi:hypothetical protein
MRREKAVKNPKKQPTAEAIAKKAVHTEQREKQTADREAQRQMRDNEELEKAEKRQKIAEDKRELAIVLNAEKQEKAQRKQKIADEKRKRALYRKTYMVLGNRYCFCHTQNRECQDDTWIKCCGSCHTCAARNYVCFGWWKLENKGTEKKFEILADAVTAKTQTYYCSDCTKFNAAEVQNAVAVEHEVSTSLLQLCAGVEN